MNDFQSGAPIPAVRKRSRTKIGLVVAAFTLIALIGGFELVARSGRIAALRPETLDPIAFQLRESNVEPHPYLAYALKPSYAHEPTPNYRQRIHHNSLGFRGKETTYAKPPGTYRIVCIGGSSVYGQSESTDEAVWCARLEVYLNQANPGRPVEVINGGCRGYSTFEMLINLELRLVDFAPDLVLVYESINDMRCALYPGARNDNAHWRALWPVARKGLAERALESSRTYLAYRRYLTGWLEKQGNLGTYVIVDFGRYRDDYAQPTDVELGFANFRRNLRSIVAVAREHGAGVLLSTQAMRFSDIQAASSFEAQRVGLLRCRQVLAEVASEEQVPLVDTAAVLEAELDAQVAAGARPDDLFVHEVHPTDKGSDRIARFLADKILELRLIPGS